MSKKLTLVQSMRRASQSLGNSDPWGFGAQRHQLSLISKLYAKHGLTIEGWGACPEQYYVRKDGEEVAYYRLRHGEFRVDVGDATIYRADPDGDGVFQQYERLNYLSIALRLIIQRQEPEVKS